MASYVDYEFYKSIYGDDAISEPDFNRLSREACRRVDAVTLNKLKFAFPTDEDDAETVRRCVCKLIEISAQIEAANKRVTEAQGYEQDSGTGALRGKVISSISSGSESISYTAKAEAGSTLIDAVLSNKEEQDKLYNSTIHDYLFGAKDANGIDLLNRVIPYPGRRFCRRDYFM